MRETCGPVLRGGAGEEPGPPPPQLRPQGCDKPLGCAQPCVWGKVPPRVPAGHRPGGVEEGFDWEWEREHAGPWSGESGFMGMWPVRSRRALCSEGPVSACFTITILQFLITF